MKERARTDMDGFRERLERLMEEHGTNPRALSLKIGRNHAYIQQMITGMRNQKLPSVLVLRAIGEEFGMTVDQLLGDNEPARAIHRLTEQELYDRFGIKPYEQPMSAEGIFLSAGPGKGVPQGIDDTITRKVPGRRYLWEAPVVGDCMQDEINPGEVVIYSTRLGAEINKIMVALRDEEELLIKRLVVHNGAQLLRPNRGDDVPVDERIRFLGRGVSVQRPLL